MYTYALQQWLLFFYIYCFLGWCFESSYVSLKQHKWVNRGFLSGPFLPIYGSGALAVLVATLPVRNFPVLVYIFGLLGATLLELVTGILMEKMFHVRYWDYSSQKFNYKGHICLSSSIAWGFFSMAMIYGFHRPIERAVLWIPEWLSNLAAFAITIWFVADFTASFRTAMELRDILDGVEKVKEEARKLQKRAEIIEAFLADEAAERTAEWQEKKDAFMEELRENYLRQKLGKERIYNRALASKAVSRMLRRNPSAVSKRYAAAFAEYKEQLKNSLQNVKEELMEKIKK